MSWTAAWTSIARLSLTRRTSLSFATGLTGARDEGGNTHYYVTGRGTLSYELGRSWTAALNYRRGVDFNQSFGQPIVMDMVSAGRSLATSAVAFKWVTGVAGSWGTDWNRWCHTAGMTRTRRPPGFETALTRELGISVYYAYRHYLVDDPSSAADRDAAELPTASQSRATLDLWVPLFTRARRPDASR